MDRKEIIERLREMANGPAAVHGTDALDAFAAAADMLAADGWVKVSERLPEESDVYWCAFTNKAGLPGCWLFTFLPSGEWIGDDDPEDQASRIYAWFKCPLPPEPDHD